MKHFLPILVFAASNAAADPPEIVDQSHRVSGDVVQFNVTLRHPDTGWDHYADGWRIETPDGTVLGTRELLHPHVPEQPFTRSLSGVKIPEGLTEVRVRAKCNVDGWSKDTISVTLAQ